jgi:ppGpp synthetase/RelA/SpoT-type nucleotidyltranferase
MKIDIVTDYKKNIEIFNTLSQKMEVLLKELMSLNGIEAHSITSRVKAENSLSHKLASKKDKYKSLYEITDIVGCRIITYFDSDVDKAVQVISDEFEIDKDNSIDKMATMDPDRFGYLSYHIVCKINDDRAHLKEYEKYRNIRFEVQVRSILQHAWAEIEHDLGYKNRFELPNILKRRFSRVAGLLEIADREFCEIKSSIEEYKESLEENQILYGATLDKESLEAYVRKSDIVERLDNYMCTVGHYHLDQKVKDTEREIEWFTKYGIKTISDLDKTLRDNERRIMVFIDKWLISDEDKALGPNRNLSSGISLFYLNYLLVGDNEDREGIVNYIKKRSLGSDPPSIIADDLEKAHKETLTN